MSGGLAHENDNVDVTTMVGGVGHLGVCSALVVGWFGIFQLRFDRLALAFSGSSRRF